MDPSLTAFHPQIASWFTETLGTPTDIQHKAWPHIIKGRNVLISAPTGTGKTLTAFMWAINQLVTGKWEPGRTHVLYVSPLKALNTDIRRNLLQPLADLEQRFAKKGEIFPDIQVQTRSGDTPQTERRHMLRHPPEILITTPESLNLLLSSRSGISLLTNLDTVILDEIHTLVNNKRGVHLITAVDRLVPLSGEFQRIAISATVKPLSTVSEYVAGLCLEGDVHNPRYVPREISCIRSDASKAYALNVRFPQESSEPQYTESFWKPLIQEFRGIIQKNRSTLFFARSRRQSENITLKINSAEQGTLAYAHHGSLAKELRLAVENKLKAGELKAIIATNSLELGIDIGALDEVVLIQSPPSISAAVQRVGRSGHRVGETSRGTFYPTYDQDFVQSAVIARAVLAEDIEEVRPVEGALDVLAQILISLVGMQTWDIDALFVHIRTSWPYRRLSRKQFDLVLNMLAGRYADTRIRELKPRISLDRLDNTVAARKGALLQLYISGGTIPDRGYYRLRHEKSGALIGELDEEFVWEASVGQTFNLGAQHWKISRITHNDVFVDPAEPKTLDTPFWKGEVFNRGYFLSRKIGEFLETADSRLQDSAFHQELETDYCLESLAARYLLDILSNQKQETSAPLPHRHHVLVEHIQTGPGGTPGNQTVIHTVWGGRVNRPFALALEAAWEEQYGYRIEVYPGDDSIALQLPHAASSEDLFSLVTPANLEAHLRRRLESTGFFGARFRENAGRALLLTKRKLHERMPLWMNRLRSQKLLQAVMELSDFPILLETWRSCLQDEFDLGSLKTLLHEIAAGTIRISECSTSHPSPLARGLSWAQIDTYMYAGDGLPADRTSRLRSDLIRELVFTPGLRPSIPSEIVRQFERKRQRIHPGYAPSSARELVDWVKERVLIPWPEWQELQQAMDQDRPDAPNFFQKEILPETKHKLVRLEIPETKISVLTSLERIQDIQVGIYATQNPSPRSLASPDTPCDMDQQALAEQGNEQDADGDAMLTALLSEWLQFYGPLTADSISEKLGLEANRLQLALDDLITEDILITGPLVEQSQEEQVCDTENFEILLRMKRAAAAPQVTAKEIDTLQLFLARIQGLATEDKADSLFRALESLAGLFLPADLWEAYILPARSLPYTGDRLDALLRQGDLFWQGDAYQRVRFFFEQELSLLFPPAAGAHKKVSSQTKILLSELFTDPAARYGFSALLPKFDGDIARLEKLLWENVWKGQVSNDTFSALRLGLLNGFQVASAVKKQQRSLRAYGQRAGRPQLSRWKESQAYPGSWLLLPQPSAQEEADLVELEEQGKDRVRILLDRYGILFREILHKEASPFRWADVFRTLRLMELSGEVVSGYFFQGIPGPQFMSQRALHIFQQAGPEGSIYWMNALDPASLCGIPLDSMRGKRPARIEGNLLVFHGSRPVLISRRKGRQLTFHVAPDHERIQEYLIGLRHLLFRDYAPLRRLTIETINQVPAPQSPYLAALENSFDLVVDVKNVSLYRKIP